MAKRADDRDLRPWRTECGLEDGTEHEMYVMAASNDEAMFALTNYLRAERGLKPFQDGLGIMHGRAHRMPDEFAAIIKRVADPLPPEEDRWQSDTRDTW